MGFSLGKAITGAVKGFSSGGLTGAATGVISGLADAYQDKSALAYQNKQNIKLWNMQNEYNNPKAQMQRYIDAGLNPNLIYSQQNTAGDITGGTLGNSDSMADSNSLLNGKSTRMVQRQQLLNMETSRRQSEAQTDFIGEQILNAKNNREIESALLPYRIELLKAQAENIGLNMDSGLLGQYIGKKTAKNIDNPVTWLYRKGESLGERFYNWLHS